MAKSNGQRSEHPPTRARPVHGRTKRVADSEPDGFAPPRERSIAELLRENTERPALSPEDIACPNCGSGMSFASPVCGNCGNRIA
jgi:hypothetical protein